MKNIKILFAFLFFSSAAFSQVNIVSKPQNFITYILVKDSVKAGEVYATLMLVPPSFSTAARPAPGGLVQIIYNSDSGFMQYSTGSSWVNFGTGSGGGGGSYTGLYGINVTGTTIKWDSANVRKIDTVYSTGDSALTFKVNGGTAHNVVINGDAVRFSDSTVKFITPTQAAGFVKYADSVTKYVTPTSMNGYAYPLVGNPSGFLSVGTFPLTSGYIYIGNVSNIAAAQPVTGVLGINNAGVTTINNNTIGNAALRQSGAYKIIGNASNATANVADIGMGNFMSLATGSLVDTATHLSDYINDPAFIKLSSLSLTNTYSTGNFTYSNTTGVFNAPPSWGLIGNIGTNSYNYFIGPSDNHPLIFKLNNAVSGYVDSSGGNGNTLLGYIAGNNIYHGTGTANASFGYQARSGSSTTMSNNTDMGYNAGDNDNSSYQVNIGAYAGMKSLHASSTDNKNINIGYSANQQNPIGTHNITIGTQARFSDSSYVGSNIAIGDSILLGFNTDIKNSITIGHFLSGTRSNEVLVGGATNFFNLGNGGMSTASIATYDPSPSAGDQYYNTDSAAYVMYNGTKWIKWGGTSTGGGGSTNTSTGSGLPIAVTGTNNIKSVLCVNCKVDTLTASTFTITDTVKHTSYFTNDAGFVNGIQALNAVSPNSVGAGIIGGQIGFFLTDATHAGLFAPVYKNHLDSAIANLLPKDTIHVIKTGIGDSVLHASGDTIYHYGINPINGILADYATQPGSLTLQNDSSVYATKYYARSHGGIAASNTINQYLNGYNVFSTFNTDSIPQGSTNLYFTNALARSAISNAAPITYNSSTGVIGADTVTALTGIVTKGFLGNQGYITASSTNTLTNKTIAAGSNTISGLTNSNLSGSAGITSANLSSTISAGSCTNCNLTYDAAGRVTVAANGSGGSQTLQQVFGTQSNIAVLTASDSINQSTFPFKFGGGGQVQFDSTKHLVGYSNPVIGLTGIDNFGTSISFGLNATTPDSNFANRTGSYYSLPVNDHGISSSQSYSAISTAYSYINAATNDSMVVVETYFNDLRNSASNNLYAQAVGTYGAFAANQFMASYVSGSDNTITTRYSAGGAWTTGYNMAVNANGKTTTGAYCNGAVNDSIVTVFATASTGIAIGLIAPSGSTSVIQIYIDNTLVQTLNFSNVGTSTTYNPYGLVYTGLSNTAHRVKMIYSSGSGLFMVDYIGIITAASSKVPLVLVQVPYMNFTASTVVGSTTKVRTDSLNNRIIAFKNAMVTAGLPVYTAYTNNYYTAVQGVTLSSDSIHPNNAGHAQIAQAIEAALSSAVYSAGTFVYSNDGHFYGSNAGSLSSFAYKNDITLDNALSNGGAILQNHSLIGNGFNFNATNWNVQIDSTYFTGSSLNQSGAIYTYGSNGGCYIGGRNIATNTPSWLIYSSNGTSLSIYNNQKPAQIINFDSSYRTNFYSNSGVPGNTATATIEIGGNRSALAGHTPLKLDSGILVSTVEEGAFEFNGSHLYFTTGGATATRQQLDQQTLQLVTNAGAATTNVITTPGITSTSNLTLTPSSSGFLLQQNGAAAFGSIISTSGAKSWTFGYLANGTSQVNGSAIIVDSSNNITLSPGSAVNAYVQTRNVIAAAGFQTITSGSSSTGNANYSNYLFNPASVISSYTFTMPASPIDGQIVNFYFGGTITGASAVVTSLTISANSGQTMIPVETAVACTGNTHISLKYIAGSTSWYLNN